MADSSKWMTQEAFDRLTKELEERSTTIRTDIARRIEIARQEGDLKENGGYHAAREEQSFNETRIQQLEGILKDAHVGEPPADDGVVEPGMLVTAKLGSREKTFLLGSREAEEGLDIEVYSPQAPLGSAIMGAKVGDTVEYKAPSGKMISVKIVKAVPYKG